MKRSICQAAQSFLYICINQPGDQHHKSSYPLLKSGRRPLLDCIQILALHRPAITLRPLASEISTGALVALEHPLEVLRSSFRELSAIGLAVSRAMTDRQVAVPGRYAGRKSGVVAHALSTPSVTVFIDDHGGLRLTFS